LPWILRLLPTGKDRSIRRFMLVAIALALAAVGLAISVFEYQAATAQLRETRDRALGRIAAGYLRSLRAQDADTSKIPPSVFQEELGATELPVLRFRISDEHGNLLGGDPSLPAKAINGRDLGAAQARLYDAVVAGEKLRIAQVHDYLLLRAQAQPVVVQVAESEEAREIGEHRLMSDIFRLLLLRLTVAMGLVWLVIVAALRPLEMLRDELQHRKPNDLAPLNPERPLELAPLVAAVNTLLHAQQESIDQQRKFLSDASHQLRTPIAVLQTLVQGTLQGHTPAAESLPKMMGIIERTTNLTNQLLSMAKAEQLIRRGEQGVVRLDAVARECAVELAPLIARKRLDFSLQAPPIQRNLNPWLLGELLKNLLSNAIHHSKPGGELGIVVREFKNELELIVWDHGGGVAEDDVERLFEPFNASKGGTGIGLGLSICKQIAESMNGSVSLFNRVEGGKVTGVDAVVRWIKEQDASHSVSPAPGAGTAAHRSSALSSSQ